MTGAAPVTPPAISEVADSEFAMLSIARAIVDQAPGRDLGPIAAYLHQARTVPALRDGKLSEAAVDVLEQTLGVGLVLALMRRGGWMRTRCAHDGDVRAGRLWERHAPPALHVSPYGARLLLWLTAAPLRRADCEQLSESPRTVADHLLAYAALDLARRVGCATAPANQPAFRLSALCWLGFVDLLSATAEPPRDLDFGALTGPDGEALQIILEALQPELAGRWAAIERAKRHVRDSDRMRKLGAAQELVVGRLLAACDRAGRRDLAGFALTAAADVVTGRPGRHEWIGSLSGRGSIAARAESRRAAGAFLRALATLKQWREEAAATRFFDDGYDAAQLLLSLWEPLGDSGYAHARAVADQLELLDVAVTPSGDYT